MPFSLRGLRLRLLAIAMSLAVMAANSLAARAPLRLLPYAPSDNGTPSSQATVTFSRPVAGMLGQSIEARRLMSVSPPIDGIFEWRDPIM
ncbi:MAG: hypothetical protein H7Z40_11860 [Phycisphaerae bacterium]|nr:hypothetical protein [Gemmatimonadaceae bacterium]